MNECPFDSKEEAFSSGTHKGFLSKSYFSLYVVFSVPGAELGARALFCFAPNIFVLQIAFLVV
jgi:hypothetical protein